MIYLNEPQLDVMRVLYLERPPLRAIDTLALERALDELAALGLLAFEYGRPLLTPAGLALCEHRFGGVSR